MILGDSTTSPLIVVCPSYLHVSIYLQEYNWLAANINAITNSTSNDIRWPWKLNLTLSSLAFVSLKDVVKTQYLNSFWYKVFELTRNSSLRNLDFSVLIVRFCATLFSDKNYKKLKHIFKITLDFIIYLKSKKWSKK